MRKLYTKQIWDLLFCAKNSTNLGIGRLHYVRVHARTPPMPGSPPCPDMSHAKHVPTCVNAVAMWHHAALHICCHACNFLRTTTEHTFFQGIFDMKLYMEIEQSTILRAHLSTPQQFSKLGGNQNSCCHLILVIDSFPLAVDFLFWIQ